MREVASGTPSVEQFRSRLLKLRGISPPLAIAQELIQLVGDDHAETGDVVDVVEKSPEMTARILCWANSAYYGERNKIHSVKDGIIRVLGLSTAKSLLLAVAISRSFDVGRLAFFPSERFWYLAVATASLGRELAQESCLRNKLSPGTVYTAGLIHNIGLLALVHTFPEELEDVFTGKQGEPINVLVSQRLEIDPCMAGGWLGKKWGFPEELVYPIRFCREPSYQEEHWLMVRLIGLASIAAEYHLDGKALADIPAEYFGDGMVSFSDTFSAVERLDLRFQELKNLAQLLV